MTHANDWITDRRPTEADGDEEGDVRACRSPGETDWSYLHWSYLGEATPWKHCADWQPPTAPKPTKPALAVGQRWRRRDGEVVTVRLDRHGHLKAGRWCYTSDGIAPGVGSHTDLIEFLTLHPTPTPRKFKETPRRTITDGVHTIDAIDKDGVAWWMTLGTAGSEPEWHQLPPLPAKESQQ